MADQLVYFALGVQGQVALTDGDGVTGGNSAAGPEAGRLRMRAVFPGTVECAAAAVNGDQPFQAHPGDEPLPRHRPGQRLRRRRSTAAGGDRPRRARGRHSRGRQRAAATAEWSRRSSSR
ncbi:MAG: hypothetical protein R2851_02000 [Caldilineaceae bacterium]